MVTFALSVKRESVSHKKVVSGMFPEHTLSGELDLQPGASLQNPGYSNGLLSAIARAYSLHAKLSLRPDDIWHSILVHFGIFVNTHPEKMRKYLVKHDKKLMIEIVAGSKFDPSIEALCVPILQVREELKTHAQEVTAWAEPHFSTTTDLDHLISTVELMGAVKAFFGYKFCYDCGLSEVELKGEKKDWEMLLTKIDFIAAIPEPAMQTWASDLRNVLAHFVAAWENNINEDFWQRVCKIKARGSGGESTVSGWMMCFAPFDDKGNYMTTADDEDIIGMTVVDIEINDNGNKWVLEAHAGSYRLAVQDDAYVPVNGLYFTRKTETNLCE